MKKPVSRHFGIANEIRDFIIPLSEHEVQCLERNILRQGCRDPIVVWEKCRTELIIIDGHHRYAICMKHNIPFQFKRVSFSDIDDVKLWMIENQVGRRNLNRQQLSFYRGLKYLSLRNKRGGFANVKSKGNANDPTSEVLSKEFNVSASTIKRDGAFAESMNYIGQLDPAIKLQILNGSVKVSKSQMHALIKEGDADKVETFLATVRASIENHNQPAKLSAAPTNRLTRIKGMVMSTIARLIKEKRKEDLYELKALVNKLEAELFSSAPKTTNYNQDAHNILRSGNTP